MKSRIHRTHLNGKYKIDFLILKALRLVMGCFNILLTFHLIYNKVYSRFQYGYFFKNSKHQDTKLEILFKKIHVFISVYRYGYNTLKFNFRLYFVWDMFSGYLSYNGNTSVHWAISDSGYRC